MSDPTGAPPPPLPPPLPSPSPAGPTKSRGLGWFFAVSGAVLLFLTLGCILAFTGGNLFAEMSGVALVCGSPTLILGGVFLWLGSRRLKR